jgi:ElaB/YqjD/DUF883 family membrane-anchored ribosome-binding protein
MRRDREPFDIQRKVIAMAEPIKEAVEQIDESASQCCAEMQAKASEFYRSVEDYVNREPMKAVLIAAGLGLVAGIVLSRR